jgi:putative transposase
VICRFIAEHKARFGVAPICAALTAHGCTIAPGTYYAWARRAPSRRALWDTTVTEILAAYYEPDSYLMRGPITPRMTTRAARSGARSPADG